MEQFTLMGDAQEVDGSSSNPPGAHEVSSVVGMDPVHKALETPVILDKMFELLSVKDRKTFREVKQLWWRETEAIWRNNAWIKLTVDSDGNWTSLTKFYELFSKTDDGEWNEEVFGLLKNPFRRFSIREAILHPFTSKDPEQSRFFWGFYGTNITHLELQSQHLHAAVEPKTLISTILLEKCPNLVEFTLEVHRLPVEDQIVQTTKEEMPRKGKVAKKLKKFHFLYHHQIIPEGYSDILNLIPNIEDLAVCDFAILNELTEKQMQIEKFRCEYVKLDEACYVPLLKYVKTFPNSLKMLELDRIHGGIRQMSPLYEAISGCPSLSILKLRIYRFSKGEWLTDFEGISLPNLKELEITITMVTGYVKFDFSMLNGFPKLEILKLSVQQLLPLGNKKIGRQPGTADWIYPPLPEYGSVKKVNGKLWNGCETLKELSFDGWQLNQEDIALFHEFFPSLEYLGAALTQETLLLVCNTWQNIKTVCLTSSSETLLNYGVGSVFL